VTRARGVILLAFLILPACGSGRIDTVGPVDRVILSIENRVSFEQLLAVPGFAQLARAGGAGLMAAAPNEALSPSLFQVLESAGIQVCSFFAVAAAPQQPSTPGPLVVATGEDPIPECPHGRGAAVGRRLIVIDGGTLVLDEAGAPEAAAVEVLRDDGATVRRAVKEVAGSSEIGVVVVGLNPSAPMAQRGDVVTPALVARATSDMLFMTSGKQFALTSDTTRQDGLVSSVDVAPTILDLFGLPAPAAMTGRPIRFTDAPAPFDLHRRHLEQRRIRIPVQMAELGFVAALGLVGIPALLVQRRAGRLPPGLASTLRLWALAAVAFPIPLAAGGLLPRLSYGVVVPFVGGSVAVLVAAALWARRWGPLGPFFLIGAIGLAFVVADLAVGRGLRIPLLGGTMFDGVRYYGLPNAFIGLLLAGALFAAAVLPGAVGFGLLFGAGVLAGYPSLGANIGASLALFAAAAVWWTLRVAGQVRPGTVAAGLGTVVVGLALVLLANRYLAGAPTHATRLVEASGGNPTDAAGRVLDRLGIGFRMLMDVPAGWLPVAGIPIILGLVLARSKPIGDGLAHVGRYWREVLIALTIAGIVSYLANDTGVAAVGLTFMYALTGMAYPAFLLSSQRGAASEQRILEAGS
jgi:hypothetical protein